MKLSCFGLLFLELKMLLRGLIIYFILTRISFSQTALEDSSLVDEIELTFGIEGGILKTSQYLEPLKDFTYQGEPVDQTIPFSFAPVFTVQAGLRGFGFNIFAFMRNSFLNYGADGNVYIKDGMEIFSTAQELLEWGGGLYYKINPRWSAGLQYSRYSGEMRGREKPPGPMSSIDTYFSFKQLKASASYHFVLNEKTFVPLKAGFTLYSYMPNVSDQILIEFPDQYTTGNIQYRYGYNGKPFNLTLEAELHFDFVLTPLLRYEYLSIGSTYHIHMFSLLLRWMIPAEN